MAMREQSNLSEPQKVLVGWLNDAYATEQNQIQVLENHIQDAADHPQIQSRLRSHLTQTRKHSETVEGCIKQLGGSTSASKSTMGKIGGFFSGLSTGMTEDELVKNCLADYSMEHFEIASYKSLIAGAEALGEHDVADACRQILRDEEDMAAWLERNLGTVVQEYIDEKSMS